MIIVQVGEPSQRTVGDHWFDPTTKITCRASPITSSLAGIAGGPGGTSHAIVWTPIKTRYSMVQALSSSAARLQVGQVFVESGTDIPHMWDGNSWIPAVAAGYNFPQPNPQVGDTWTEPMSQVLYIWSGQSWIQMIGGPGAPTPGATVTGPVGNSGPVGPVGSIPAPTNHNYAPGYIFSGTNWVPAPGVVGAVAPQIQHQAPLLSSVASGSQTWQVTAAAPMTGVITIHGTNNDKAVEIDANGKVTLGPNYTPDTASDRFWQCIERNHPTTLITTLRESLKEAHDELQAYRDAGFKLPKKAAPFDPNSAWDAAMGIIK